MNPEVFRKSWAVILAGGSGTRFWPKSLKKKPKQLWALGGGSKTMLELTLERLDAIIPPERRLIVTNKEQMALTQEIAGKSCHHFLPEPEGRNTAAALTLAALEIKYLSDSSDDSTMLSFHADHIISEDKLFLESLEHAVLSSQKSYLTLVGIKPKGPETGFGYIKKGKPLGNPEHTTYKVEAFFEKPDLSTAKDYVKDGSYFWNSGLFIWNNAFFLQELQQNLTHTYTSLNHFYEQKRSHISCFESQDFINCYKKLEDISIDHGLLEKSSRIAVTTSSMTWLDVGSWDALPKAFPIDSSGNFVSGETFLSETKNCVIDASHQFVATLGLEDIVVVTTEKAVLVCHKDKAQEVKKIVSYLKEQEKNDLL